MLFQGQVGTQTVSDGSNPPLRQMKTGELAVTEVHGRFYEQVSRGNVFSIGCSSTALSATTITLTATSTPILAVYNPSSSTVNLVMLQCALTTFANTLTTPASPGVFVWASSTGNAAISTGSSPFNRKTMATTGSAAKGFPGAVALTGLTNNLVIFDGADIPGPGPLAYGTITPSTASSNSMAGIGGIQNFDGSLIVPPGGVLALYNTTSSTTFNVAGRLMWEEVAI